MSDYKQKYLKYKNKYIELKNELFVGGVVSHRGFSSSRKTPNHRSHSRRPSYDNKSYSTSSPDIRKIKEDYALSLCKKNNDDCNNKEIIKYYISYAYYEDNLKKYNDDIKKYNDDIKNYEIIQPVLMKEWDNKINQIKKFFDIYNKELVEFYKIKKENQIKNKNEYNECTKRSISKRIIDKFDGNSIICEEKVDESEFTSVEEYFKKLKDEGEINEDQYKIVEDLILEKIDVPLSVEEYKKKLKKPVKPAEFTIVKPTEITKVEPDKLGELNKVEPVKPAELTKVEPDKPAEINKVEPVKPTEITKVEPVKPTNI